MASLVTHTVVGLALGKAASDEPMPTHFWWLCAICACLPDLDVIGFAFGIRYGDLWGHRGLSHSLVFALLTGCFVVSVAFRQHKLFSSTWWRLGTGLFLVTASHGVLDALTDGGLGIAFFSPFDTSRYFFPFQPVAVSPIGVSAFFSTRGFQVIASEVVWIWGPTLALLAGVLGMRWYRARRSVS